MVWIELDHTATGRKWRMMMIGSILVCCIIAECQKLHERFVLDGNTVEIGSRQSPWQRLAKVLSIAFGQRAVAID